MARRRSQRLARARPRPTSGSPWAQARPWPSKAPGVPLVKGNLDGIVRARRLAHATMRNIRQNLFFALDYNASGVPVAAGLLSVLRHPHQPDVRGLRDDRLVDFGRVELSAPANRGGKMKERTSALTLCAMLSLTGCATKTTLPPQLQPVNGQCDTVTDMCLLGTPSATSGSRYEWVCLGRNGGTHAQCSVPTALYTEDDEFFSGQGELVERVKSAGPLRGKLVIDDNPDEPHGIGMRRIVLEFMRVPEENLAVSRDLSTFEEETLVVGYPNAFASDLSNRRVSLIAQQNILHVAAAGNLGVTGGGYEDGRYDYWYPDHPHWERHPEAYENAFEAFATGKLILARFTNAGNQVDAPNNSVHCGMAKEFCYSLLEHPRKAGSSSAATALSALTFYLFQLWDTPQEVIGVLNVCAEDVGEPGIDEEYGRGVVSVACDTVQNREVNMVASSMNFSANASPVLEEMMVPSSRTAQSFRPFFNVNGRNPKDGHRSPGRSVFPERSQPVPFRRD